MEFGIAKSSKPKLAESKLYEFLVPFEIYDFNTSSARQYGNIRAELANNGTPIGLMDMLIALANEMTVVTNNTKEFDRISELQLENWTK